eukprot:CCRYP_017243-RA/>CCRYP_017243-RA protein AED:0.41 eAED:0.30 QI:0/0/0/1/1/1/5/0/1642
MAAVQKLEYADVAANFGTLAPLIGQPNVHSIRHLKNQCITKTMAIANPAAPSMGYVGIFMNCGEYAMSAPTPYIDPPNPGATPNYNVLDNAGQLRFLNDNDRAIIKAQHAADLIVWWNHEIVHKGPQGSPRSSHPRRIKTFTWHWTRGEWNPSTPIETFLLNIETQQVFATKAGHPFHTYLLLEVALSVIKDTRQFKDELREYNHLHLDPTLVQWHQFKRFWIEKYAEYERDCATMQDADYHGANNAEDDSNSLASLTEAFTSLQSHHTQQDLALQTLLQEVSSLRQLTNNTQASTTQIPTNIQFPPHPPSVSMYPPHPPPYLNHTQPPAPPLIHHMPAIPLQMPPPPPTLSTTQPHTAAPTPQHYGNRTRNYRNNTTGGRGRNNYTTLGQRNNPPHPIKRYNNWWYCYSCGFDTPHDGTSCTRQVPGHIAHLTRDQKIADMHLPVNQQRYCTASHAGHHKRFLPSQAASNGYPQYQRDSWLVGVVTNHTFNYLKNNYDHTPTPTNYNTMYNSIDDDDDTTVIASNCSSRHPPPSDAATVGTLPNGYMRTSPLPRIPLTRQHMGLSHIQPITAAPFCQFLPAPRRSHRIAMAHALITYEEAQKAVGILPSLAPRPNAVNIRALSTLLEQRLEKIPCTQAPEHGFAGMVMPEQIYALRSVIPWTEWPDPGNHPAAANTSVEQRNVKTIYDANRVVFDSQENVRRAINDALNEAIPNAFRKPIGNQMGQKVYTVRDNPRDILSNLRTKYGTSTPAEKRRNNVLLDAPWDPNDPIEALFDRIEDCFIFALICKPQFTMEQIIDKAIVAIQLTGLYETALLEWSGFAEENKTWQQLKLHFEEAYELRLASGQGTAGTHGYVNSATANDDDSIASIQESIVNFHMANNANYQSMQDILQAARAETASLRAELQSTQQSFANFARATPPAFVPPIPQYVPALPPGQQQFTPTRRCHTNNTNREGAVLGVGAGRDATLATVAAKHNNTIPQQPLPPRSTFHRRHLASRLPPFNLPAHHPIQLNTTTTGICASPVDTDDEDEATVVASNVSYHQTTIHPTATATTPSTCQPTRAPSNKCPQATQDPATQLITTRHQHYAIFDSGATAHFLVSTAHVVNKRPALKPLTIRLPNGKNIVSTHTCNLDLPWLPHSITEAHIVPGLSHSSLISTRKFCDAGCQVTLDQQSCKIYYQGALVLTGTRDETTGLWKVPIHPHQPPHPGQHSKPSSPHAAPHIAACHTALNVYTLPSKQQQLKYMHQAFFSPPIATLLKAINNNQLQGFPLMKRDLVHLKTKGYKPTFNVTDNQATTPIKSYLNTEDCKWQFVEPHNHRVNAAERAIQTFKNHFISGLCSTDSNWPLQLWDTMTEQAIITLNLLRTSRIDPSKSAYHQLHGHRYNWNAYPLAPPGTKAVIYESPTTRTSWGTRGLDAWYCGPAFDHYRNMKFYVPSTKAYRVSGSYDLFPQHCILPTFTPAQHTQEVHRELFESLQTLDKPTKRKFLKKIAKALEIINSPPQQRVASEGDTTTHPTNEGPLQRVVEHPTVTTSTNPTDPRELRTAPRTHHRTTRNNVPHSLPPIVNPANKGTPRRSLRLASGETPILPVNTVPSSERIPLHSPNIIAFQAVDSITNAVHNDSNRAWQPAPSSPPVPPT